MGRIAGDGSDIVMINGRQIRYQGIGNIKKDVSTAAAVEKTAADGYKKYFLESPDHKNRVVVYGDRLDFSFLAKQTVPIVMVNGQPYKLVAQDEQDSSWFEGFMTGAKQGIGQAGAATVEAAKQVISQIGVAGTLAVAGGTTFALIKGIEARVITGTAAALAIPALKIVGAIVALGIVVAGVAGGIKGAAEAGARKHDTKAIAGIVDPTLEGDNPDPGGSVPGTQPGTTTPEVPAGEPVAPGIPPLPSADPASGGEKQYHILPVPQTSNAAARRLGTVLQDLEKRKN